MCPAQKISSARKGERARGSENFKQAPLPLLDWFRAESSCQSARRAPWTTPARTHGRLLKWLDHYAPAECGYKAAPKSWTSVVAELWILTPEESNVQNQTFWSYCYSFDKITPCFYGFFNDNHAKIHTNSITNPFFYKFRWNSNSQYKAQVKI